MLILPIPLSPFAITTSPNAPPTFVVTLVRDALFLFEALTDPAAIEFSTNCPFSILATKPATLNNAGFVFETLGFMVAFNSMLALTFEMLATLASPTAPPIFNIVLESVAFDDKLTFVVNLESNFPTIICEIS